MAEHDEGYGCGFSSGYGSGDGGGGNALLAGTHKGAMK